jgi:hypothetical protein
MSDERMIAPKYLLRLLIVVCAFSSMMAFADQDSQKQSSTIHSVKGG